MILRLLNQDDEVIQGDWATQHGAVRYIRHYFYNTSDEDEVISGIRQIEDDIAIDFVGEKHIGAGYKLIREGESFSWIPR